ncbi:unnamed protein product [Larinioides sclopetarius]|uniref:Methionyl-tRNA formyltransferase n=1 Tax=Larinioides sclopetarius TaxID=280406 RepID=A0AAV2B1N8_9ARAC
MLTDCPVRQYATQKNMTVYSWPYILPSNTYDIGIVVSFGHMISSESILACKYGIINGHPSLLPRWRGAAPIIHTILNGDVETGVTITQVSPNKFDVGNILVQNKYKVPAGCSAKMLTRELSKIAASLFDIYTFWKDKRIVLLEFVEPEKVENANIQSLMKFPASPGLCYFHKKRKILFVKCQDGWCGISFLKVPKRGKISAQDFYNGFISKEEPNDSYFHSNNNKPI